MRISIAKFRQNAPSVGSRGKMSSMIPAEGPERGQDSDEGARRGSRQEKGRYLAEALGMPRVKLLLVNPSRAGCNQAVSI